MNRGSEIMACVIEECCLAMIFRTMIFRKFLMLLGDKGSVSGNDGLISSLINACLCSQTVSSEGVVSMAIDCRKMGVAYRLRRMAVLLT